MKTKEFMEKFRNNDADLIKKVKECKTKEDVYEVAKAEGISLTQQGDWRNVCSPQARFSTLQDLDAGRHTEIEMLAGTLIRLAKKHHLEVPFCEYTYYAIKALEEKADGIIA